MKFSTVFAEKRSHNFVGYQFCGNFCIKLKNTFISKMVQDDDFCPDGMLLDIYHIFETSRFSQIFGPEGMQNLILPHFFQEIIPC